MSFNLSIGAAAPLFSSPSSLHAQAGAAGAGHLASYDDENRCGTVPHRFPSPPPTPHLGGMVGNIGDALRNLPPISGNIADVLRDVLGGGGRMHI